MPLAAVLWNGGISFGGVLAFIFADLIILPILNIYRRYYGRRMTAFLGLTFYVAMAGAAYLVQGLFGVLGLIPTDRHALVVEASISLNYTSVLNVVFLTLAAVLIWRFRRTGGGPEDDRYGSSAVPSTATDTPNVASRSCPSNASSAGRPDVVVKTVR